MIASWQLQVLEGELLLRLIPWAGGPCACRGREHRSNSVFTLSSSLFVYRERLALGSRAALFGKSEPNSAPRQQPPPQPAQEPRCSARCCMQAATRAVGLSSVAGKLQKMRLPLVLLTLMGLADCIAPDPHGQREGALAPIQNGGLRSRSPRDFLAAASSAPIPPVPQPLAPCDDEAGFTSNESFIANGTCWLYNAQPELCETLYYSPAPGAYQRCRFNSDQSTCRRGPALGCEPQCLTQPPPATVFGVASPGIGVGINSGLSNMLQMTLGLVLLAQEHGAAISLPTMLLRSTYKEEGKYVNFSEVFDVARWHALTCKGLPPLTDAPPQRVFSSNDLWKRHEQYIFEIRNDPSVPPRSPFEDLVMDATSHPSARIRTLIAQVAPPQPYACLHARIETDLNRMQTMSSQTQQMHFPWLAQQLRDNEDLRKAGADLAALFVAVDLKDCGPQDREAMDEGVWPGVPLAFAGESAASDQAGISPSEAPLVGAIVDKSICIDAQFFVGWPGSTFANTLVYSRILAGHARTSNWYYNLADGVRRRGDDGRGGPEAPRGGGQE